MNLTSLAARSAAAGLVASLCTTAATAQTTSHHGDDDHHHHHGSEGPFRRVATFPAFRNTDEGTTSVAEIVAAADHGNLLVYTDSQAEVLGFVDITDPAQPQPAGAVALQGEPTSVAVKDDYALVCVNTSVDYVNTSGDLDVVDVHTHEIVRTLPLGGQPDSIAVSPDGRYAVIAIENERDEDLGDGEPPQMPPGYVVIVDLKGKPKQWKTRVVDLVGVPDLFPEDPEPEFVDINVLNVAAVTMQENNHVALIWLPLGIVIHDFPLGTVDLTQIDTNENDLIEQVASLDDVPREPDAIAWLSPWTLATADEGDLFGGSRGFTTWLANGTPLYQAASTLEHLTARLGHYPEGRSENKGCEPEGLEFARFGHDRILFVGSERSNVVFVYDVSGPPLVGALFPRLLQVLPTGVGPEGLVAIPERGLFAVACEEDARDDVIRSSVMIYQYTGEPNYPTVVSQDRANGVPIPWAALSGLAADPHDAHTVYAVHDSFYQRNRIYTLDVHGDPAVITAELELVDANGVLLDALVTLQAQLPGADDYDPTALVNADGSVVLDPEGIAALEDGTFWVASEGAGNLVSGVSDPDDRPFESPNLLLHVEADGTISQVVLPPLEVTENQLRFGYEGVAVEGQYLYVAFQREWKAAGDPSKRVRIGRYDTVTREWGYAYYPIESASSPNGGWVGLSELTRIADGEFAVLERDNQGGPDARVKLVTTFSVAGVTFRPAAEAPSFDVLSKTVVRDLYATDAFGAWGGHYPEKLEGMAVLPNGTALIVNDNDGVDDNNGETLLLRLPHLFD